MGAIQDPEPYREQVTVTLFGKRIAVLDLSHEISPDIPIYPGHMKVAFWRHLSHEESRLRLGPQSRFRGYAVTGFALCDHVSTHVDAIYHFNPDRPDLTIDTLSLLTCITPACWIDLSAAPPRTHIRLRDVQEALTRAGIANLRPGSSLLYYTGAERLWNDPMRFITQYPGLDEEASRWILDQGIVNVLTDAASTDNPADLDYPNHRTHAERLVVHTEIVKNIPKIPRHQDFTLLMLPLRWKGATGSPVRALAMWEA